MNQPLRTILVLGFLLVLFVLTLVAMGASATWIATEVPYADHPALYAICMVANAGIGAVLVGGAIALARGLDRLLGRKDEEDST